MCLITHHIDTVSKIGIYSGRSIGMGEIQLISKYYVYYRYYNNIITISTYDPGMWV